MTQSNQSLGGKSEIKLMCLLLSILSSSCSMPNKEMVSNLPGSQKESPMILATYPNKVDFYVPNSPEQENRHIARLPLSLIVYWLIQNNGLTLDDQQYLARRALKLHPEYKSLKDYIRMPGAPREVLRFFDDFLTSDSTKEQYTKFLNEYIESDFSEDILKTIAKGPTIFDFSDTIQNYEKMDEVITKRFNHWQIKSQK